MPTHRFSLITFVKTQTLLSIIYILWIISYETFSFNYKYYSINKYLQHIILPSHFDLHLKDQFFFNYTVYN